MTDDHQTESLCTGLVVEKTDLVRWLFIGVALGILLSQDLPEHRNTLFWGLCAVIVVMQSAEMWRYYRT